MEYIALYRKYRPSTFDEVAGQKIIVQTLKNVLKNNKLTHSYLFIGPRGTGKTSIAKIFAKTINCENQKDGISCEKCENCISCNNNENIDIIEMDAASNNGVDEIREIKNHVTLLPSKSKYKVYIIDEVHMLTIEAFNALLKTLEEPPKHVIFILATTEPQKVPLTIKSRCQNFEFKLLPKQDMIDRLKIICDKENIKIDDESLLMIANNSNGGMRDAISFLDQVNAYSDNKITINDINLLNGRISEEAKKQIVLNVKNNELSNIFDAINIFEKEGKNFSYICEDLSIYLKNILIDLQKNQKNEIFSIDDRENIMNSIIEFNSCINNMKLTKDKRIYFDLCIIKVCSFFEKINVNNTTKQKKELEKVDEIVSKKNAVNNVSNTEKKLDNYVVDYSNYKKMMDIRLNNILLSADKQSLSLYKDTLEKIKKDISNLDDLKIINLLNDCEIKAGSNLGLVISIDNDNLLNELYENYKEIEKIFSKKINNNIKVCIINEKEWMNQREIFIKKIKSKEKLEIIDDSDIIKEIEKKENQSEFDDLLEIGD